MLDIQDAISLLEQREARKASHLLEQLVAEMPAYATARVLLARSYEALDDWDLALAVWQEALQIVPNSPVIREGLDRTASRSVSRRRRARAAEAGIEEDAAGDDVGHDRSPATPEDLDLSVHAEPEAVEVPRAPRAQDESRPTHEPSPYAQPPHEPSPYEPPPHESPPREPAAEQQATEQQEAEQQATEQSTTEQSATGRSPADQQPATQRSAEHPSTEPPAEHPSTEPPAEHPSTELSVEHPSSELPPTEPSPVESPDEGEELSGASDTGTPHFEDLDRLISELESARIVPRPDLESVPSPDLEDDIEDVVSETLARIYASQGQYDEAARVYELLAGQHPEDADDYLHKASNMRSKASDGL